MKCLIAINLSLAAILTYLFFPPFRSDSSEAQFEKRREAPGPRKVERLRGIEDSKRVQVVHGESWSLNESALAGLRIDAITPGAHPQASDEICELIEATPRERALLDEALVVAFSRLVTLERAELSVEARDGESWIRVGEHIALARHNLGVLEKSVEQIVGDDRAKIVMHGFRQDDYFRNPGLQFELFFFLPDTGGASFSIKKCRDGSVYSNASVGEQRLSADDGFDLVKWRYGHLFDVEAIKGYLEE